MMEDMYGGHHPTAGDYSDRALMSPDNLLLPSDYHHAFMMSSAAVTPHVFGGGIADDLISATSAISAVSEMNHLRDDDTSSSALIKARIASHPRYPRLLQAYIDCHKVGAPPEIEKILEELRRESELCRQEEAGNTTTCLGADPELDDFMDAYCEVLDKYKLDLSRPFDEATTFLNDIESQLRHLCKGAFVRTNSGDSDTIGESSQEQGSLEDEGAASSDEEYSGADIDVQDLQPRDEERDLKDQLLRRFGSHISSLKLEFSKKKKKGKLPREARQTLFEWWNAHYKWPYPTEADKISLAETTGLDQRQINNWFINQRKRHWKPSENMQFALMDNLSGQYFTDD